MSNNFNKFISKCIYRNPDLRYNWRQMANDPFVNISKNANTNSAPLLNEERLKIIFEWIEYKYNYFIKYYLNFDFKNKEYVKYYNEITQILTALWIELKTVIKIFHKSETNHLNFFNEEISFIKIFNDGNYKFLKLDFEYLSSIHKIFDPSLPMISQFIDNLKNIQKNVIKILIRFLNAQNKKITQINSEDYLKDLLHNIGTPKIQEYFNLLINEGIAAFNQNDIEGSKMKTSIGIFICEYTIMIRLLELKKSDNSNNVNLISEYFQDEFESNQITLSVIHLNELRGSYVFISFISGLFSYYFNKQKPMIFENNANEKNEEREKTLNELLLSYPEIMKFLLESQK